MDQSYWYLIPAKLAEEVKPSIAILFGLISNLANKEGYCYAKNDYLADKLGMSKKTIKKNLTKLDDDGWIERKVEDNNKRRIYPQWGVNNSPGVGKNFHGGEGKNFPTQYSNNNKVNKYSNKGKNVDKSVDNLVEDIPDVVKEANSNN